jgi:hypothetical protein
MRLSSTGKVRTRLAAKRQRTVLMGRTRLQRLLRTHPTRDRLSGTTVAIQAGCLTPEEAYVA